MKTGKEFINDLGWDLTRTMYIDDAVEIVERAMEAGRQEIRDAVVMLHRQLPSRIFYETVVQHIAPKPQRYVVAPAGVAGEPEITKEFQNELAQLINRHSVENQAGMPDFIMAEMLCNIIKAVGPKVKKTLTWHGCDSICHSKEKRYVAAPAGAELGADEQRVRKQDIDSAALRDRCLPGPVYLKPGWTSDKECRDLVAKLLRDEVEVREE